MSLADAFAPVEASYRAAVMADTFGHLAPKKNKVYPGYIVFAVGCFGNDPLNPVALECEFKGLNSSPWFFEAMEDFTRSCDTEEGGVYRFDGKFRNYEFSGVVRRMRVL